MATADVGAKARLRRTRTGCLKCRVRRRKCDEGKPKCQRCVDGDFECQYGTRLSFLEKNAITVAGPEKETRSPSYSTLKFVEPDSAAPNSTVRFRDDVAQPRGGDKSTTSATGSSRTVSDEGHGTVTNSPLAVTAVKSLDFPVDTQMLQDVDYAHQSLPSPGAHPVETSPANTAYDTALNVLLSLGNDHASSLPGQPQTPSAEWYFASPRDTAKHLHPTPARPENVAGQLKRLFPTCAHLPQDKVVQLLRHFRYNIAPWLDIGDPEQTFGLKVCRIAMESPSVLASLLALSHTSLDPTADVDTREYGLSGIDATEASRSEAKVLNSVIIFAVISVQEFLVTTPTSWKSPFTSVGIQALNSALAQESHATTRLAVAWMLLRLDVSVGLMNSSPVSIPDILPFGPGSMSATVEYDREPLLLCAKVLNHCFAPDTATQSTGLSTTQSWKTLFDALSAWYANRPQALRPMLEVDGDEDGGEHPQQQLFPQVLFTNGGAVLANQIYHAAMLLLLLHRPRTLPQHGEHGGGGRLKPAAGMASSSPLWHAQRVCGISLSNDSRAAWDFSLVASFYLAARRMTYEPQQRAILQGVNGIAAATGWNVAGLSAQLVKEWQPD